MITVLFDLLEFFSHDLLESAIRKGWHDSLVVRDFSVRNSFSSPNGTGVHAEFSIKNKLGYSNNISFVHFIADKAKVEFNWRGSHPDALGGHETKQFGLYTQAIHPHGSGSHQYQIEVGDVFGRTYTVQITG